ncbi:rhodanese domain-containing protein CG4456-like [Scylla paramamosain]|uniref:rhodanese domain-containing protein CG4456-like n=1 Tax=Scylla paramamosain TaxID=85552 RepID=UPI003083B868
MRWVGRTMVLMLRGARPLMATSPSTQVMCRQSLQGYSTISLPPDISFDELKDKMANKEVTVIDVRMPKELREDGMIPESKNLALPWLGPAILQPETDFASQLGFNKPGLDEPIVVSCLAGVRARTAQLALMAAGYANVRVYVGSFEDWIQQGGKVDFLPPKEKQED